MKAITKFVFLILLAGPCCLSAHIDDSIRDASFPVELKVNEISIEESVILNRIKEVANMGKDKAVL